MTDTVIATTAGTPVLDLALEIDPRTSLRPEPFGALAYHSGNRRLVFVRHRDLLAVIESLATHADVRSALVACEVAPERWDAFGRAIASLIESEMLRERAR